MKNSKGITLIALVITIIVLLILAGISIATLSGENGILKKASLAKSNTEKAEIKEELELQLTELIMEAKRTGQKVTKEKVIEQLTSIGAVVIDATENIISGEYKNYEFIIDLDTNKVTIGGPLTGIKPTGTVTPLTSGEGLEKVEVQVVANTEEGEIASIEAINGAILKTENSVSDKIFEITSNGTYYFKITGTNERIAIVNITITNILVGSESLLEGISKINHSGENKIKVVGAGETKIYSLNVIKHDGDLTLDGTTSVEGASFSNNTYSFGASKDIGTSTANAQNTVVLKVEGNLTISSGITVTSVTSNYGGPKGLIIYCTGELTNNGTISMSARGAKATGENVYLWKNADGSFECVPATGATGGDSVTTKTGTVAGLTGKNGSNRGTRWRRFRCCCLLRRL